MEVSDNGRGFSEKKEYPGFSGGLGLTLVEQLTRQIGGEVSYTGNEGFSTLVLFDCPPQK